MEGGKCVRSVATGGPACRSIGRSVCNEERRLWLVTMKLIWMTEQRSGLHRPSLAYVPPKLSSDIHTTVSCACVDKRGATTRTSFGLKSCDRLRATASPT